jgi:hypothetical protein
MGMTKSLPIPVLRQVAILKEVEFGGVFSQFVAFYRILCGRAQEFLYTPL